MYLILIDYLGKSCLRFKVPTQEVVYLVSGSIPFLNDKSAQIGKNKGIFITDHFFNLRRGLTRNPLNLIRFKHSSYGGATNYEGVFGYSTDQYEPILSPFKRKLGDYMDYGIPPIYTNTTEMALSHKKILPIKFLDRLVHYPTHFSATGFGYRYLTSTELVSLFGFDIPMSSSHRESITSKSFPIVPIHVLDTLLKPLLVSLPSTSSQQFKFSLPPIYKDSGFTFLPKLQRKLPHTWFQHVQISSSAVKSDKALVDNAIWDNRILLLYPGVNRSHLDSIRTFLFICSCKRLYREFLNYMQATYPSMWCGFISHGRGGLKDFSDDFSTDLNVGRQVLRSYSSGSFMSWDGGSTLIFWRWPMSSKLLARDGFHPFQLHPFPRSKNKVKLSSQTCKLQVLEKLLICLEKNYLVLTSPTKVTNYIDYFPVPKGESDIRLVFNGTSCGINQSLFSSNFWLPMSNTMTRLLSFGYRVVDIDLGEMFLNFPLHPSMQMISGVDLSPFKQELQNITPHHLSTNNKLVATWTRLWFGMKQSPEYAATFYYLAEEFIRGNHKDANNPLRWDTIKLNMLGDKNYNPTFPNIYKWDERAKRIAGDLIAYVDDLRAIGFSMEEAWKIARRVCSYIQYLGIQDAARKRRLDEGPWAGGVYGTKNETISKTVTDEKWMKGRTLIFDLDSDISKDPSAPVSFKRLERIRGFLCHLAMVYDAIFPYLKGFHLTLAQHLPKRNEEGWKLSELEWIGHIESKVERGRLTRKEADNLMSEINHCQPTTPLNVILVPRFHLCMKFLKGMFEGEKPPVVDVRSSSCTVMIYGFVDASGSGFGSTLLMKGNVKYRIGTWSNKEDQNSSNWREFENLVCEFEQAGEKGWLKNSLLLLATDNQVVESCLYKGNSTSPKLYDLIVRFKLAEIKFGVRVLVTHVSGKRMQVQGTDGVSRGSLRSGVSLGEDMLAFCPWSKDPVETNPSLKSWINKWTENKAIFLQPKDWFVRGHDINGGVYNDKRFWYPTITSGIYVWSPPAAVADACLEELRKARMKRKQSTHIVVIQRLMTPIWLKQLNKAADCIFTIPAIHDFWPSNNYEPLIVAVLFPYLTHRPYQLKGTYKMLHMGRSLSQVFKENKVDGGDILFKFLLETRKLQTLPESMVWKVLYFGRQTPFSNDLSSTPRTNNKYIKRKRSSHERFYLERKKQKQI